MNENNKSIQQYKEDDIDLRELFKTIWKSKVMIISITTIMTLLAVGYTLIKTPIYEVKSNIQIGYIGQENGELKLLDDPSSIVKILNVIFHVEDGQFDKEEKTPYVTSIKSNKNLQNFIQVKTEGVSNEEALKKSKEVVEYLQTLYQRKIDLYTTQIKNSIQNTKHQIVDIKNLEVKNIKEKIKILKLQNIAKIDEKINFLHNLQIPSIDKKIKYHVDKLKEYTESIDNLYKENKKLKDTTIAVVSSMQMLNYQNLILSSQNKIEDLKIEKELIVKETIPNLESEKANIINNDIRKLQYHLDVDIPAKILKLEQQIDKLNYDISDLNIQNSQVVGDYIVKNSPVKPKKALIIVVAFITGLILSIFLVFFLEFIKSMKQEEH